MHRHRHTRGRVGAAETTILWGIKGHPAGQSGCCLVLEEGVAPLFVLVRVGLLNKQLHFQAQP